jgi:predicted polyphosphate/ATP-dependent NAD kinase
VAIGKTLGLIVNPVAGLGGRVGLKGSDGAEIQRKALALGATPRAPERAAEALERIRRVDGLEVVTYPGEMGEDAARTSGYQPVVIGSIRSGKTTPEDTRSAAREMLEQNVDLLLFTGGDGTARDIYSTIGEKIPVLGIPAGVKIHSAVFGTNPRGSGDLAALYLAGRVTSLREAEVMDIDEDAFRRGVVAARLYGYLRIPFRTSLVQTLKVASAGEEASLASIAYDIVETMEDDCLYIIGPGTTTRSVMSELGLDKTLIGVDIVLNRELLAADVNEDQLLALLEKHRAKIVVTPIGGQGCIFGRGNQQISPKVIEDVGRDNIIVVSTTEKLYALGRRPLWVDTGDQEVDNMLTGYIRVVTGYNEQAVRKVSC